MKTLKMLLIASTILLSHASFANDKQEEGKKNVKEYAEAQHGKQGMGKHKCMEKMHGVGKHGKGSKPCSSYGDRKRRNANEAKLGFNR